MTTLSITVETICSGLAHWQVSAGAVVFPVEWSELQAPLAPDEVAQMARLVLRAKYAGTPINALGDLMLNGVTL